MSGRHDEPGKQHGGGMEEMHMPPPGELKGMGQLDEPGKMMPEHYKMVPWVHAALMVLGVWLATSPFALGYQRSALIWSDVISGLAIVVLAALSLGKLGMKAAIANSFVGIWLLFAPLVFWAPEAASYNNDTLVGMLVITFSLLIPMGMPMAGPEIPPGWTYNPSSWPQRAPIIALGFVGFFLSRSMTGFQLGYVPHLWDPFFGGGTDRVLDSEVSKAWPVSDAGLGAVMYLIEVLSGFMGDKRRWRTMPWMVAVFGLAIIPLGVTSIVLVITQPLAVGAWCSPCLAAALAMLIMIPLSLDEVVAMIQFLARQKREGRSLWRTFWLGGSVEEGQEAQPVKPEGWRIPSMAWGFTPTFALTASALLGLWLMLAPGLLGLPIQSALADNDHLVGALIAVMAVIAMAEIARPVRFVNLLLGAWLAVGPWLLPGSGAGSRVNDLLVGLAVVALSLPLGKIREHYGRMDRAITWSLGRRPKADFA